MSKRVEEVSPSLLTVERYYLWVLAGDVVVVWDGCAKPPDEKSLSFKVFRFFAGVKFL